MGLALGDALGARFEGGPVERFAWKIVGRTAGGEMRWTDDTQMSLDLAESVIACGKLDADDLAKRFAESYRWDRGYGAGAAKLLKKIARGADWREANRSVFPDGSFGNGAAMRAPVAGLIGSETATRQQAEITHAHELGIEGAVLISAATAAALEDAAVHEHDATAPEFRDRLEQARTWLERGGEPDPPEVARTLGNGVAAPESVVTAIYLAARFLKAPFLELQGFVAACGGDVDTIGAMAGAIWGARNGADALPSDELGWLEDAERLRSTAIALHELTRE